MTDSGFSSAASNRSASSIVKPAILNPFNAAPTYSAPSKFDKENMPASALGGTSTLPKPSCTYFQSTGGRPVLPSRILYGKNNGGYSPGLYSPKEMSPMSSLAFDFRELNTSQEASDTPRKRLSLSSVSSLDSPHPLGHPSPAALSFGSTFNSPSMAHDDGMNAPFRIGISSQRIKTFQRRTIFRKQIFKPYKRHSQCSQKVIGEQSADKQFIQTENETEGQSQSVKRSLIVASSMDAISEEVSALFQPINEEGCFTDAPSLLDTSEMESKFEQRALQEKDDNICDLSSCGDAKLRRFKSVPASKNRFRLHAVGNGCSGKENSPVFSSKKQIFSARRGSIDSPSPLRSISSVASPSPFHALGRRRQSNLLASPNMTSSPMVPNFASSTSSAFSAVQQSGVRRPLAEKSTENQEEMRKDAERRLRDAKSPTDGSLTPEKSVVPGSIASLTARARCVARPASALPFYRAKSSPSCTENISPIPVRANKRSLDSSCNASLVAASKRHKRGGASFVESNSTRRKMAFASKERKVKSADAAFMHSSPISSLKSSFRPISAPAQMLCFDDEAPLSHSRLCSTNDSDSEGDDVMVTSSAEHDRSDADERLLEEMLSENARANNACDVSRDVMNTSEAPSGLDGLISAPLLLSASTSENKENDSSFTLNRIPKPRELFRSPSAPPVVPSRRSRLAIRRAEQQGDCCTPFGIRRRQSPSNDIPSLPEVDAEEETSTMLNRSRSFNELDIMRAVDLGCSDENLVGDFSRACTLETVSGKHQDLKYISPQTLIDLMNNKHDVGCFEIIDCRYPYEYEGGHVTGANSIWEEEKLFKRYFHNPKPMWAVKNKDTYKPPVLVFYCEFSSERGPRMARALRSKDREVNRYPHLHYPEIYVLKSGYKNFFHTEGTKEYCEPQTYRPMTHEDFAKELRMCRIKSKTWAGEKTKCGLYNRLKRL